MWYLSTHVFLDSANSCKTGRSQRGREPLPSSEIPAVLELGVVSEVFKEQMVKAKRYSAPMRNKSPATLTSSDQSGQHLPVGRLWVTVTAQEEWLSCQGAYIPGSNLSLTLRLF